MKFIIFSFSMMFTNITSFPVPCYPSLSADNFLSSFHELRKIFETERTKSQPMTYEIWIGSPGKTAYIVSPIEGLKCFVYVGKFLPREEMEEKLKNMNEKNELSL